MVLNPQVLPQVSPSCLVESQATIKSLPHLPKVCLDRQHDRSTLEICSRALPCWRPQHLSRYTNVLRLFFLFQRSSWFSSTQHSLRFTINVIVQNAINGTSYICNVFKMHDFPSLYLHFLVWFYTIPIGNHKSLQSSKFLILEFHTK